MIHWLVIKGYGSLRECRLLTLEDYYRAKRTDLRQRLLEQIDFDKNK